jgi:DNA-binding protein H-NS
MFGRRPYFLTLSPSALFFLLATHSTKTTAPNKSAAPVYNTNAPTATGSGIGKAPAMEMGMR